MSDPELKSILLNIRGHLDLVHQSLQMAAAQLVMAEEKLATMLQPAKEGK